MDKEEYERRKKTIYEQAQRELGKVISDKMRNEIERLLESDYQPHETALSDLRQYLEDHLPEYKALLSASQSEITTSQVLSEKAILNRLRLVRFVLARADNPSRIDWEKIAEEWNCAHPSEKKSPQVLKATYHRAKSNPNFKQVYFGKELSDYTPLVIELASHAINPDEAAKGIKAVLADIGLRGGEIAVASTSQFTRILESKPARATEGDY